MDFTYPATLTPDEDGGFVVTFRDVPEAITQGETVEESVEQATDALEEALAARIRLGEEIPVPSAAKADEYAVPVPTLMAAKAALSVALRESGWTQSRLAEELGCDEKVVRRLLDPRHRSKLPRLQDALAVLGRRLTVRMVSARAA